ncbi:GNAT family N-acetyltransferase [Nocardia panacis]|uniref:GNAT family N-acetyltransferase n=2 Tax=Nocardia panacis TaxID=2340916 RepID=A0A3A4K333_9NOCA|nr:GNAT family N-acetyltransferase [Nocardia panacis]
MIGENTGVLGRATAAAGRAADLAGVRIATLSTIEEIAEVCRLCAQMWQSAPQDRPVTPNLLRALAKSGGYIAGAYDGDEMVGVGVGFHAAPADLLLHSHIAGVVDGLRGRNVGFALKTHQRAWALSYGIATIGWTFDPLVRRNAYFNIAKLGALPVEYLPDFYGPMDDVINAGDATDRLLIRWDLRAPSVAAICEGKPDIADIGTDAVVAVGISPDGAPVPGSLDGARSLVGVPADITALRASDPAMAARWRAAVREALTGLFAAGSRVTGFDRTGGYLLTKEMK